MAGRASPSPPSQELSVTNNGHAGSCLDHGIKRFNTSRVMYVAVICPANIMLSWPWKTLEKELAIKSFASMQPFAPS